MNIWIRDGFVEPERKSDVRILIDVFRASTTTLALLESGVRDLLIANDFDFLTELNQRGYHIFSEVFELGTDNSPSLVRKMDLHEKPVALKTANLTTAIEKNFFDGPMLIGCFNNLSAVARRVQDNGYQNVEIVPAGSMETMAPNIEDSHCAEIFLKKLRGERDVEPDKDLLARHIQEKIAKHQRRAHYIDDMQVAVRADVSETVPVVEWYQKTQPVVFSARPWR